MPPPSAPQNVAPRCHVAGCECGQLEEVNAAVAASPNWWRGSRLWTCTVCGYKTCLLHITNSAKTKTNSQGELLKVLCVECEDGVQ